MPIVQRFFGDRLACLPLLGEAQKMLYALREISKRVLFNQIVRSFPDGSWIKVMKVGPIEYQDIHAVFPPIVEIPFQILVGFGVNLHPLASTLNENSPTYRFYEVYKDIWTEVDAYDELGHVIDKWHLMAYFNKSYWRAKHPTASGKPVIDILAGELFSGDWTDYDPEDYFETWLMDADGIYDNLGGSSLPSGPWNTYSGSADNTLDYDVEWYYFDGSGEHDQVEHIGTYHVDYAGTHVGFYNDPGDWGFESTIEVAGSGIGYTPHDAVYPLGDGKWISNYGTRTASQTTHRNEFIAESGLDGIFEHELSDVINGSFKWGDIVLESYSYSQTETYSYEMTPTVSSGEIIRTITDRPTYLNHCSIEDYYGLIFYTIENSTYSKTGEGYFSDADPTTDRDNCQTNPTIDEPSGVTSWAFDPAYSESSSQTHSTYMAYRLGGSFVKIKLAEYTIIDGVYSGYAAILTDCKIVKGFMLYSYAIVEPPTNTKISWNYGTINILTGERTEKSFPYAGTGLGTIIDGYEVG